MAINQMLRHDQAIFRGVLLIDAVSYQFYFPQLNHIISQFEVQEFLNNLIAIDETLI